MNLLISSHCGGNSFRNVEIRGVYDFHLQAKRFIAQYLKSINFVSEHMENQDIEASFPANCPPAHLNEVGFFVKNPILRIEKF